MSKLYDHKSGQWIIADENKVDDLVKSGNYTFAEGERIPVVAPDGELGDIPAEKAHDAFNDGFRWATAADKQFDNERKLEAIKQKAFGDSTTTALGMGAARGLTLGGSDVAIRGLEEIGAIPQGTTEAAAETKERQPIASGTGEVGGIILSTALSGGSNLLGTTGKIGQGGYKLGSELGAKALAAAAGKEAKETLARKIIAKVVPVATGSAVENAIYGLGQGVSEAALGKPDDVVDNLVSGVGMGALTGLTFGAGFGAAGAIGKPILAKAAEAGGNLFDKAISGSARLGTKVVARAALNAAGETRLAGMVGDLVDTEIGQAARSLAQSGKWDEVKDLVKAAKQSERSLMSESSDLAKGITKTINSMPKIEGAILRESLVQNGGDVSRTMQQLSKTVKSQEENIVKEFNALTGPRVFKEEIANAVTKATDALDSVGTPEAALKAKNIRDMFDARDLLTKTEGDEVLFARALKRETRRKMTQLGEAYAPASKLVDEIDNLLREAHPNQAVKEAVIGSDATYRAYAEAKKVLLNREGGFNTKRAARVFNDPDAMDALTEHLNKISEYAPELKSFAATRAGTIERTKVLQELIRKIETRGANSVDGKLSIPDMEEFLVAMGADKEKFTRLNRLKEIEGHFADIGQLQPMDRAIRILKATGQDASKIEKLIPYQKELQALDDIRSIRPDGNFVGDLVGRAVKGTIGGALGGPFGAAIGAAMGGGVSVHQMLRQLTTVERLANKGAKLIESSIKGTVDALTSPTVRRIGMITRRQAEQSGPTLKEKRSEYKALAPKIQAAAGDPNVVADHVAKAFGTLQGTPLLKQAMATKMTIASQYLAQHMPKDPMAGKYLSPEMSGWEPSDSELSKFHRRMAVVQDPKVAIAKIADGSVSPEEMDALKVVYPEVFNKLKNQVVEQLMTKGANISYDKRIAIGTIFGIPTDPSLVPENVAKLQATFDDPTDEGGRPEGSTSSGRKPNLDTKPGETVGTETDNFQRTDS